MSRIILSIVVLAFSLSTIAQDTHEETSTDTASLVSFKTAVEAHPDSLSAHEKFIIAFEQSMPNRTSSSTDSILSLLDAQYAIWMQRFPKSAIVPFALGDAYSNAESPNAKPYLLKAVSIDSKLAKAWEDLWMDAERWGDFATSQKYLLKAKQLDPQNPEYAFYYAFSFSKIDSLKYRKLSLDVAKRFPNSERGAQALCWLAFYSNNQKDKITIYEQLKNKFPPQKFNWSVDGMFSYFDLLLQVNPTKALMLAQFMSHLKLADNDKKGWNKQVVLANKIVQARKLINEHKPSDAEKILKGASVNRWSTAMETLNLFKAEAIEAAGDPVAAYDSTLIFFAKTPYKKTEEKLLSYGAKLGKNAAQVDSDVWQKRNANSKFAPSFKLQSYLNNDSISLADFHGKVVLLTFWFPGCGPCRAEFPYFQKVLSEFKGKEIEYIGINVLPQQDEYVVPFMKSSGYNFTPLHENGDTQEKAYQVRGEPTNFLIDPQGRIIYSDFMIKNTSEEEMLELMIRSLVAHQYNFNTKWGPSQEEEKLTR